MYPGIHARTRADQPCIIMASTGRTLTYGEFDALANRLAHLFRSEGLVRGDHVSILMENNEWYLPACSAAERSGLYFTPVNSHLTPEEVGYILDNSLSRVLITSRAQHAVALEAMRHAPKVQRCVVAEDFGSDLAGLPSTPIADESTGAPMLYSSGTTGRPKGILKPLSKKAPADATSKFLLQLWSYREGQVYLSPAPLYHSAPQGACGMTIRLGGTVVIMDRFDPEQFLVLIERYRVTHTQVVPTMFSRLLKLPDDVRLKYDLSSLELVIHAAAPCPVPVKEQMIDWLGPIIREYYGATEGLGFAACDSTEWSAHKGTVGKVLLAKVV